VSFARRFLISRIFIRHKSIVTKSNVPIFILSNSVSS
jgi:hypothetical protein